MAKRRRNTVERRISFFRILVGHDDAGKRMEFDPAPALSTIDNLPWQAGGRYLDRGDGSVLCAWPGPARGGGRLRLATIRRGDLPLLEDGKGALSPLPIPDSSGLAEITYFSFFPGNVVGVVRNNHSPTAASLGNYLRARTPSDVPPSITLEPLLYHDVSAELDRLQTIRVVDLKAHASFGSELKKADKSLGEAFEANKRVVRGNATEVGILISAGRGKGADLGKRMKGVLKRVLKRPDIREESSKFKVTGLDPETRRSATIDLLSDKLIAKRDVLRQGERSRALDPESVFEATRDAYEALQEELEQAVTLVLEDVD